MGPIQNHASTTTSRFSSRFYHYFKDLSYQKRDDQITYFYGTLPIFSHAENDVATFKMITAQFYVNGYVKQMDIVRAFGVSPISVKRAVKCYQEAGVQGFYIETKRRGAVVLTATVLQSAQQSLDEGIEAAVVANQLGVKWDTFRKAIRAGRLQVPVQKTGEQDNNASIGMAAHNVEARKQPVAASVGELDAPLQPEFQPAVDVPKGGILLALPALLATGLLTSSANFFKLEKGYYGFDSLLMVLAFTTLARVKSIVKWFHIPGHLLLHFVHLTLLVIYFLYAYKGIMLVMVLLYRETPLFLAE